MQDLDLLIVLRIEDECLVIALGIMLHLITHNAGQAFTAFSHIGRLAPQVIFRLRCEIQHG